MLEITLEILLEIILEILLASNLCGQRKVWNMFRNRGSLLTNMLAITQ